MKLSQADLVRWNNRKEKERDLQDRANDPTFNAEVKRQKMDPPPSKTEEL